MPNVFDITVLNIVNQIPAELEVKDGNPTTAAAGSSLTLYFLYIGGTLQPAHAFRIRVYETADTRDFDAEYDLGLGLIRQTREPRSTVFNPAVPVPGGRWDHDNNPSTPGILRTVSATLEVPQAESGYTWYGKTSILQNDEVFTGRKDITVDGESVPVTQTILIGVELGTPEGGVTAYFNAIQDNEGNDIIDGYEYRVSVFDEEAVIQAAGETPIHSSSWLSAPILPDPLKTQERPRALFGVFDEDTLRPIFEDSLPYENERRRLRIELRLVQDGAEGPQEAGFGSVSFIYPFGGLVRSTAPRNLREIPTRQPPDEPPKALIAWDIPSDLGHAPGGAASELEFYQFRWKRVGQYFRDDDWINLINTTERHIDFPDTVESGDSITVQVRAVVRNRYRRAIEGNLNRPNPVLFFGEIAELTFEVDTFGGTLKTPTYGPQPIEVLGIEAPPPDFGNQRIGKFTFYVGKSVKTESFPVVREGGEDPITYTCTLPNGLLFDERLLYIRGVPQRAQDTITYVYTATDARGLKDELGFTIEILGEFQNFESWEYLGGNVWQYGDGTAEVINRTETTREVRFVNIPLIDVPTRESNFVVEVFNAADISYEETFKVALKNLPDRQVTIEPTRRPPRRRQSTLEDVKEISNWNNVGGGRIFYYKDGGTGTVRNTPGTGTRGVTFISVPLLKSPLVKTGSTSNVIDTIFQEMLTLIDENDLDPNWDSQRRR